MSMFSQHAPSPGGGDGWGCSCLPLRALMQSNNLNEAGICRMKFRDKVFHDIWAALQIAAKRWVHKPCCLRRAIWVAGRQMALGKIREECASAIMLWNGVEDDEKAWTEVVATGGQTFLLFGPGEGLSGQDLLHFGFSPLQLRFLVELGQDFLLAFPFITCIYLVTTGMRCLELTAALQQQCCGFSVLLYQTTISCLSPEGEPHHRPPAHLFTPCWNFPSRKPAKTPWLPFTGASCMSVGDPRAVGTGIAKGPPSPGLLWDWDNPGFALEGRIFSERRSGVRLGFRSC